MFPRMRIRSRRHSRLSRLLALTAIAALLVPTLLLREAPVASAAPTNCTVSKTLVPSCGVLVGAYTEARVGETAATAFSRFERQVGKQDIVHYYHDGQQLFPSQWEIDLARGDRTIMVSWKPEAGHTWAQVAEGAADNYIDDEAAYIKSHYSAPFFLAIHHEPEDEVRTASNSGYTAADFRAMYRHVVDELRAHGVSNAIFVATYMGTQSYVLQPWFNNLWPGDDYVDWIAYDPYATPTLGDQDGGFDWITNEHWGADFGGMYNWIVKHHPGFPIMLHEWGVGEKPGSPSYKADIFREIPSALSKYPALKALVYFDKANAPVAGDVQVDSSTVSLDAYRAMLKRLADIRSGGRSDAGDDPTSDPPVGDTVPGEGPSTGDSPSQVSFVGVNSVDTNATTFTTSIPREVKAGDTLLMFVAQGVAQPVSRPFGWAEAGRVKTNEHLTTVWQRTATTDDAGRNVQLGGLGRYSKAAITVAAYRGASGSDPIAAIAGVAESANTRSHTTPTAFVDRVGSWRVSFWTDKGTGAAHWSVPDPSEERAVTNDDVGSGRVATLLADSSGAVPTGDLKPQTATMADPSPTATMWTIVLQPNY